MARKNSSPAQQDTTNTSAQATPAAETPSDFAGMSVGSRYAVFSIKPREGKDSIWVRAGSAWVNRDGSINVYLDVLPLDGKLHIRESAPKAQPASTATDAGDVTC